MKFSEIPGHPELKSKLIEAVRSNHIAHAQLFVGKLGAVNLPLALAYATYLHCQNKGEHDSCGTCPACSKSNKHIHPDTTFVFPFRSLTKEEDEDKIKAETLKQWRELLINQSFIEISDWVNTYGGEGKAYSIAREASREIVKALSLKPFESKYKVMIIWQPELMHPSAANGILKILEEPPPNTFFILVSNAAERLLPTILSRTQIVQVPFLTDEELKEFLHNKNSALTEQELQEIIQLADGNINLALKLSENQEESYHERIADWLRNCYKHEFIKLVNMADDFHELDKLSQRNFLFYTLSLLRESLLRVAGADSIGRLKSTEAKFVQDFSKVMNVNKLETVSQLISDAAYHLERNGSAKMIFLDLSLQIAKKIKS